MQEHSIRASFRYRALRFRYKEVHMSSTEMQWAHGTPERAVADAFGALRRRDGARLAAVATRASIRALAARVVPKLDPGDFRLSTGSKGELTDRQAASVLGSAIARIPEFGTDQVRCLIVGHVVESPDIAQVVFRVAYELPGQGIAPMPPEPQIATTQLVDGEWKLVLDEWADVGMPGFRNVIWWVDETPTTEAAPPAK
jgi:hypothetical protein